MADIKQAAKWIQEGKKIRRKSWGNNCWIQDNLEYYVDNKYNASFVWLLCHLLADDWVVVYPEINDNVKIIKGRMEGMTGVIVDIDEIDEERPLNIKIKDNAEVNNCVYFCDFDDVEIIY